MMQQPCAINKRSLLVWRTTWSVLICKSNQVTGCGPSERNQMGDMGGGGGHNKVMAATTDAAHGS